MSSTSTRDRILDALRDILVERGSAAVTLDAVAAAAQVSKGGLLYHFGSKQALMSGLLKRLAEDAEVEFAKAGANPTGVAPVYLTTSLPSSREDANLDWSVIAALRSNDLATEDAAQLVHVLCARWGQMLHDDIGDPVLAETIRLVGDGIYFGSVIGMPAPDETLLRQVIERLTDLAEQARAQQRPE